MKPSRLLVILALAIANGALATDVKESKEGLAAALEPCFRDLEFQVDLFGTATDAEAIGPVSSGYDGGVAAGVSFMRYFGFAVDAVFSDGTSNTGSEVSGSLIARYPVEFATFCFAPYFFTGAGVTTEDRVLSGHAGAGLEWRTTPGLAFYAEGRCSRSSGNDYRSQARLGIRLVF